MDDFEKALGDERLRFRLQLGSVSESNEKRKKKYDRFTQNANKDAGFCCTPTCLSWLPTPTCLSWLPRGLAATRSVQAYSGKYKAAWEESLPKSVEDVLNERRKFQHSFKAKKVDQFLPYTDRWAENLQHLCEERNLSLPDVVRVMDIDGKSSQSKLVRSGDTLSLTQCETLETAFMLGFESRVNDDAVQLSVTILLRGHALCDSLVGARKEIMSALCGSDCPLDELDDIQNSPIWLPKCGIIPHEDLHITFSAPSQWRTPRRSQVDQMAYNESVRSAVEEACFGREPFDLVFDRLVLTSTGTMLGLFRTTGALDADDPVTALRLNILDSVVRIVDCPQHLDDEDALSPGFASKLVRSSTVDLTTDTEGFIHCSLARLPIAPRLTLHEVNFKKAVKACNKWSAQIAGDDSVNTIRISSLKLVEMTGRGEGGVFNPFQMRGWDADIELAARSKNHALSHE